MLNRTLLILLAAAVVARLAAWVLADPTGPAEEGRLEHLLCLPEIRQQLEEAQQRQVRLASLVKALHRSSTAREDVTTALLEGRLTLLEAAARFHALNKDLPECLRTPHSAI